MCAGEILYDILKRDAKRFERANISIKFADDYVQNKEVYVSRINVNAINVILIKVIVFS